MYIVYVTKELIYERNHFILRPKFSGKETHNADNLWEE